MKLTAKERRAVELLRELDAQQRSETLRHIERQVLANRLVTRVVKIRRLKIPTNKKIETAFGPAPIWKRKTR